MPPEKRPLTRLALAGSDLGQGALHLGVERVAGHDEDDAARMASVRCRLRFTTNDSRKVLVDECQRAVLELSGEDLNRGQI